MLAAEEAERWLRQPVVVEEKLDGANVSIWLEKRTGLHVASRGGLDAMDRGGQLGRLRAWASEHSAALRELLGGDWTAYGEWLWLRHGIYYDALPDWLVVLDFWHPDRGFADLPDRDVRARAVGLHVPPRVQIGALGSSRRLADLLGPSAYATTSRREGLVLRNEQGKRCKIVDPRYRRRTDEEWSISEHNQLAMRGSPVR